MQGDEKFDLVKFVLRLTPVELYCFMSDRGDGVYLVILLIYILNNVLYYNVQHVLVYYIFSVSIIIMYLRECLCACVLCA